MTATRQSEMLSAALESRVLSASVAKSYKFAFTPHHFLFQLSPTENNLSLEIPVFSFGGIILLDKSFFLAMAEENAPEHQDRGLFGLFGKKKEEETHQQHDIAVDPYGQGHVADDYEGIDESHPMYGHVVEAHPAPVSHGHLGEAHPVPVSHGHVEGGKLHGEGEEKKHEGGLMGKLHRSNSSSTSSSSDEEEDEKGEKKKKKGGLKDKLRVHGRHEKKEEEYGHGKTEEEGEKKGLMGKIKEKLPGHHKEEEKEY
ncbi:hypothetical protein SUGI_0341030 [Cryptomeria japonica]|nr:hypothetical protein SUGI_0341030 [Cryptomeria japonica]